MSHRILVFYGSYRSDRMGIRLAQFVVGRLRRRGDDVDLVDAKAVGLPMLDRMYKENIQRAKRPSALNSWLATSGRPTGSYSSRASTIGVSNLD